MTDILGDDGTPQNFTSAGQAALALKRASEVAAIAGEPQPQPESRAEGPGEELIIWDVACDAQQGCKAATTVETWEPENEKLGSNARLGAALEVEGWTLADDGLAYCPQH
jgi:hypothetical protein